MAKSSARSMAFDEAGDPFVLIRQGKRLSICSLMGDKLTRIRDVPLRFWWFRVATVEGERFALLREDVRCRVGPVAMCSLDRPGNTKTLKTSEAGNALCAWHLSAATCEGVYGLGKSGIYRFAGAEGWINLSESPDRRTSSEDGAVFFTANADGVYHRRLGDKRSGWDLLQHHEFGIFRNGLVFDSERDDVVVAGRTEQGAPALHITTAVNTTKIVKLAQRLWCLVAHDGRLFGYGRGVVEIERDGTIGPPMQGGVVSANNCLFSGGGALYFLAGNTIHQLRNERWHSIDVDDAIA